ncbi:MAG: hypothetical protein IKI34_01950, partial [Eubacterium sp.]|nr:hypothetical protein [Eubacterium sp.]
MFSLRSDDIFSLMKTGLTAVANDEINALENYAFVWNISGSKWKNEFTESPRGFAQELSQSDKEALIKLNESRNYIIEIINKFKNKCSSANAKAISKAVYYALIELKADEKLKELAIMLDKNGKSYLSEQLERVWDL